MLKSIVYNNLPIIHGTQLYKFNHYIFMCVIPRTTIIKQTFITINELWHYIKTVLT